MRTFMDIRWSILVWISPHETVRQFFTALAAELPYQGRGKGKVASQKLTFIEFKVEP